jgi:glycosyltransferase involved in cell wall biosynthesis
VTEPVVSVLIACRDAEPWLADALDSALGQTLTALEVILVDDGSRDGSLAIAEARRARDARLRILRHATPRGAAAARNTALAAARGRWIAVLDADDRMEPDRLARMVATAGAVGADWLADDQWIEAEGTDWPRARLLFAEPAGASRLTIARFLDRDPPEAIGYGTLKPLVRHAFLRAHGIRWRPEIVRCEDFLFTLDGLVAGAFAWLLNEPLYHYRLRAGSQVTSSAGAAALDHQLEAQAVAERILDGVASPEIRAALARRRRRIEAARRYRRAIDALRARALGRLLRELGREPGLLPLLARGLGAALRARLSGARIPTLANRRLFHTAA